MKNNEFYKFLIECPNVLYLYNTGPLIYGINCDIIEALVIINDKFKLPKEYKSHTQFYDKNVFCIEINNFKFIFYTSEEWFKKVLDCHVDAWECACLNKKFIHKEHVKLLLNVDVIKLRQQANKVINKVNKSPFTNLNYCKYIYFDAIKKIKFINQILLNHKIVNYNEVAIDYKELNACDSYETLVEVFNKRMKTPLEYLHKNTDSLYAKYKIEERNKLLEMEKKKKLNFAEVLTSLKEGKKVTRKNWTKDSFIYYVGPSKYVATTDAAKSIADEENKVEYAEYIAFKEGTNPIIMWTPTYKDLFAEDWMIFNK